MIKKNHILYYLMVNGGSRDKEIEDWLLYLILIKKQLMRVKRRTFL